MTTDTHPQTVAGFLARLVIIPAWLEPRLQAIGAKWWRRVSQADARTWWRWLALNWQKVAAWWLTFGLGLTALFLLVALVAWQNPEVMLMRALGWSQSLFATGGKVAGWGAAVVLVVALPVILPAALISLAVLLAAQVRRFRAVISV
jgi:hypothetical protein